MIKVRLKEILKKKGMTLSELHEITGISMNSLSIFQNQKRDGIQFGTLEKISSALDVSLSDLLQIVQDEYEVNIKIDSYSTNAQTLTHNDMSAEINFNNLQNSYTINIIFDTKIIPNSPFNFLILDVKNIKHENIDHNIEKVLEGESSLLYQKEFLQVLSYLLIQELLKIHPYEQLTILDDVIVKWSSLFRKFSLNPKDSISFNPRDYFVNLVPLDKNIKLEDQNHVPNVSYTAYSESLVDLNIVTNVSINPETFERVISITII